MAYVAIFIPGLADPQRWELGETTVFGRSAECDVWIDEPNVSRRHCALARVGTGWVLIDLDSTNGTWLDAARVRRYTLRDGETFYIGDARVVFHAERRIEHRPADPHEALSVAKIFDPIDALAETSLAGDATPVPGGRAPRVLPHARATVATRGRFRATGSAKSLAFQRPPAMPLVRDERSGSLIRVLLRTICGAAPPTS